MSTSSFLVQLSYTVRDAVLLLPRAPQQQQLGVICFALSACLIILLAFFFSYHRLRAGVATILQSPSEFDFVVVGGGSAGCVLAARLSEDPKFRVLLLEAGQEETVDKNIVVPMMAARLQNTPVDWAFQMEPQQDGGRVFPCPRGKVMGGSSGLNFMVFVHGNSGDYDLWAKEYGCQGWSYEDVLPYFRKSETRHVGRWNTTGSVNEKYRGATGPVVVSDVLEPNIITSTFIAAAQSVGLPFNRDINAESQLGVGYTQSSIDNGRRCSTASAYLKPEVRKRSNLTVLVGAHATRVLFDDNQASAVGVEYKLQRDNFECEHVAYAMSEVVLACGSISTPQLLMLSGVGPKDHLREFNVPIIRDLAYVGEHLQDHLALPICFSALKPVTLDKAENMVNLAKYVLFKTGPYTSFGCEALAFIRTGNCDLPDPIPDLQIHLVCKMLPWSLDSLEPSSYSFTLVPTLLHPKSSSGHIRLRSANPFDPPRIQHNHLTNEEDIRLLMETMKLVRKIIASPVFDGLRGAELHDTKILSQFPDPSSDEYIRAYVLKKVMSMSHPTGTARMGSVGDDKDTTMVDTHLRVRGLKGLRVADLSICPEIPSGNTNAVAIMIGEKASHLIIQDTLAAQ